MLRTLLLGAILLLFSGPGRGDIVVPLTQPVVLGRIGHGFNLGNALEAPSEGAWGVTLQESYFAAIHQAGFKSVRVPINWAAHVGPSPDFAIDSAFFARIDWVVAQTQAQHLSVILDYHTDDALAKDPDADADRFVAIWKQIAAHFFASPDAVMFELLIRC